jgi:hypothetical protein
MDEIAHKERLIENISRQKYYDSPLLPVLFRYHNVTIRCINNCYVMTKEISSSEISSSCLAGQSVEDLLHHNAKS